MMALVTLAYGLVVPRIASLRISRNAAKILTKNGGYSQFVYMIDYKEPSLAFHQGGGLREQRDDDYFNHTSPSDWPCWLVTTSRVWERMNPAVSSQWVVLGRVKGLAYNDRGGRESLVLRKQD